MTREPSLRQQFAATAFSLLLVTSLVVAGVALLGTQPLVSSDSGVASADVSSASLNQTYDVGGDDATPEGVAFNDTGTTMYVIGAANDNVYQYSLSSPYDISTATLQNQQSVSTRDTLPSGLAFGDSGSKMYVSGTENDNIYQYNLSTNWDVSTASFDSSLSIGRDAEVEGVTLNDDGTKLYVTGAGNANIYEYDLSTAYDASSASFADSLDVSSQDTSPWGAAFNQDGSRLFMVGDSTDAVYEYSLGTAYDVSTASLDDSVSVASEDSNPTGVTFSNDDEQMFVSGYDNTSIYAYDVDISTVTPKDVNGTVVDQNGDPVANATVEVKGIDTGAAESTFDTIGDVPLNKIFGQDIPKPLLDQETALPEYTVSSFGPDQDTFDEPVVLMNNEDDWNAKPTTVKGEDVIEPPSDITPRPVIETDSDAIFSCWEPDSSIGPERYSQDIIDRSIPGMATGGCDAIEIKQVTSSGEQWDEPRTKELDDDFYTVPSVQATFSLSLAKDHQAVRVDLPPGVYEVKPKDAPDSRAITYAVSPTGDASDVPDLVSTPDLEDVNSSSGDEFEYQTTTTNENGEFGVNFSSSKVDRAEISAYKAGTELNVQQPTREDVINDFESTVRSNFREETAVSSIEDADQETLESVCRRMDSVADDTGMPYYGATTTSVPSNDTIVDGYRVELPGVDQAVMECAAFNFAEQFLNDPLPLLPGFSGDLQDYSSAELEALYEKLYQFISANDELEAALEEDLGRDLPSDGSQLSDSELRDAIQEGFATIESPPADSNFGGGGSGGGIIGGDDGVNVDDPDETADRVNETISRSWPVTGVDDWESAGVLVRLVFSDGTEEVLSTDSEYVRVEKNAVGEDHVHLEEYPFESDDAAVARVSLDVATNGGHDSNDGVARNPNFDGTIPGLKSVQVSSTAPGKSDTITVAASPEDGSNWGGVQHVNVTGPSCDKQVSATDDAASVEMCGAGTHRLAVTYTNADGTTFTEVVQVEATAASQSRPPAVRAASGVTGRFAVVGNGLTDGSIEVTDGASTVILTGIVPSDSDVPSRIVASTTGVDVARDAETTVRLRHGSTEQTIRERVGVLLHVDRVSDSSLLYRNGGPIKNPGETSTALVEHRDDSTIIDTYTGETGEVTVEVSRDPGIIERVTHAVRLRFPSLPIGFSIIPLPGAGTIAVVLFVGRPRRRRPTEAPQEAAA